MALAISVVLFVGLTVLSLALRVAGKLRLGIPVLYIVIMLTVFKDWTHLHDKEATLGLIVLLVLVGLSWIYSIYKKIHGHFSQKRMVSNRIQLAKEIAAKRGIPLQDVSFTVDENGLPYANFKDK